MSMTHVIPYFRARCKALKFKEHTDPFNYENIPASGFDRAFHLEMGDAQGGPNNAGLQEMTVGVTVRLFFKGFRSPGDARDTAILESESLMKECLKFANRLTQTHIKNVTFASMGIEPFSGSNDNALISTLNFSASVVTDVEGA